MKAWTEWERARHQVAIGGRVVDEGDEPVVGAEVTVTVMPEEFQRKLAGAAKVEGGGWEHSDQRLDGRDLLFPRLATRQVHSERRR